MLEMPVNNIPIIDIKELDPNRDKRTPQDILISDIIEALQFGINQHLDQVDKLNMLIKGNALLFALLVKLCEFNKIDLSDLQKAVANDINKSNVYTSTTPIIKKKCC